MCACVSPACHTCHRQHQGYVHFLIALMCVLVCLLSGVPQCGSMQEGWSPCPYWHSLLGDLLEKSTTTIAIIVGNCPVQHASSRICADC